MWTFTVTFKATLGAHVVRFFQHGLERRALRLTTDGQRAEAEGHGELQCARLNHASEAEAMAAALRRTSDRYLSGGMARGTWTSHMRALWDQADATGLRRDVMALLDPRMA